MWCVQAHHTMSSRYELQVHPVSGRRYIKKGRIHSEKALLKRAQRWMENWSFLLKYRLNEEEEEEIPDNVGVEHSYSMSSTSVRGFSRDDVEAALKIYNMTQEHVDYLSEIQDLTTDEDDDDELNEPDSPIDLGIISEKDTKDYGYSDISSDSLEEHQRGALEALTSFSDHQIVKNNESCSGDENAGNITDADSESLPSRPVSRISLPFPCDEDDDYDNSRPPSRMSQMDYQSYYETDFGSNENNSSGKSSQSHYALKKRGDMYGHVPGLSIGRKWSLRRLCSKSFAHRPHNAGIHGGPQGAYSMVLSATYAVDDRGEEFIYFGEGGKDPKTKELVKDQEMTRGNLALVHNFQSGNPVRIIRGWQLQNRYAPVSGYRYDGLYEVTRWSEEQKAGFKVFVFNFVRSAHQAQPPWRNYMLDVPKLPWPSNDIQHQISASGDNENSDDGEADKTKQREKKKNKQLALIPDTRSSTPMSVISDDVALPKLQLPDHDPVRPIVYPTPPHLSPSLSINPVPTEFHYRPVVRLQKLDVLAMTKKWVESTVSQAFGTLEHVENVPEVEQLKNVSNEESSLEMKNNLVSVPADKKNDIKNICEEEELKNVFSEMTLKRKKNLVVTPLVRKISDVASLRKKLTVASVMKEKTEGAKLVRKKAVKSAPAVKKIVHTTLGKIINITPSRKKTVDNVSATPLKKNVVGTRPVKKKVLNAPNMKKKKVLRAAGTKKTTIISAASTKKKKVAVATQLKTKTAGIAPAVLGKKILNTVPIRGRKIANTDDVIAGKRQRGRPKTIISKDSAIETINSRGQPRILPKDILPPVVLVKRLSDSIASISRSVVISSDAFTSMVIKEKRERSTDDTTDLKQVKVKDENSKQPENSVGSTENKLFYQKKGRPRAEMKVSAVSSTNTVKKRGRKPANK